MRLEISRRAELGMRAMLHLSLLGEPVKAAALADALGTTVGFIHQVVAPLVNAGWVMAEPGPNGSYLASVEPADLDLLQVIEAVDGPTADGRCATTGRPCELARPCLLHDAWASAQAELTRVLGATTLTHVGAGPGR